LVSGLKVIKNPEQIRSGFLDSTSRMEFYNYEILKQVQDDETIKYYLNE